MRLCDIGIDAWQTARDKGLHEPLDPLPLREQTLIRLALVHTEVSEATQIVKRYGCAPERLEALAEECADVIIRLAELAEHVHLDLERAVAKKLMKNKARPYGFGTPGEGGGLSP